MAEQPQTLTVPQALDLAAQHHRAGRLTNAEDIYQQELQTEPDQPAAIHMLGVLAYQAGKNERAVELISRALELQPDLVEAHNNLGLVLQRLGRVQSAKSSYQKAIDLNERLSLIHI